MAVTLSFTCVRSPRVAGASSSITKLSHQGHWTASGPFCAQNSTPLHGLPPYLLYIFNFMMCIILSIFHKE